MKNILLMLLLFTSFSMFSQDDTTVSQVSSRNGRIYKNNALFTGILYSDDSADNECKCTLEANYLDGKLNGEKKEWYKNGVLKLKANYKNGKLLGSVKKYDINGNSLLIKTSISVKEILEYVLKLYPPDKYTDEFLKLYLSEFDVNYENYRSNEFELNRNKNSVKNEIINNINDLNFNTIYQESKKTTLPKYSFSSKSFNLKTGRFLNYVKDPIKHLFSRTNMTSNNIRLSSELLKVNIANQNDFYEIKLSSNQAEQLKNNFNYHDLYYTYDYQILPTKYQFKYGEGGNYSVGGVLAYISVMHFYSDKNLTNLVHTINATRTYNEVLSELNSDKETSLTNIESENLIKSIDYEDFLIGEWLSSDGGKFIIYNNHTLKYNYKDTATSTMHKWTYNKPTLKLTRFKNSEVDINNNGIESNNTIIIKIRYLYNNTVEMNSNNGMTHLGNFLKTTNIPSFDEISTLSEDNNSSEKPRYVNGILQNLDKKKNQNYINKMANEGNAQAQEKLASIYYSKNDFKNAFIWYSKAANSDQYYAQYMLGLMYKNGEGINKSNKQAKLWLKKSCKLFYKPSCEKLNNYNLPDEKEESLIKKL